MRRPTTSSNSKTMCCSPTTTRRKSSTTREALDMPSSRSRSPRPRRWLNFTTWPRASMLRCGSWSRPRRCSRAVALLPSQMPGLISSRRHRPPLSSAIRNCQKICRCGASDGISGGLGHVNDHGAASEAWEQRQRSSSRSSRDGCPGSDRGDRRPLPGGPAKCRCRTGAAARDRRLCLAAPGRHRRARASSRKVALAANGSSCSPYPWRRRAGARHGGSP